MSGSFPPFLASPTQGTRSTDSEGNPVGPLLLTLPQGSQGAGRRVAFAVKEERGEGVVKGHQRSALVLIIIKEGNGHKK